MCCRASSWLEHELGAGAATVTYYVSSSMLELCSSFVYIISERTGEQALRQVAYAHVTPTGMSGAAYNTATSTPHTCTCASTAAAAWSTIHVHKWSTIHVHKRSTIHVHNEFKCCTVCMHTQSHLRNATLHTERIYSNHVSSTVKSRTCYRDVAFTFKLKASTPCRCSS